MATPEEQIAADDAAAMLESARGFLNEPEAKWAWDWAISERDGVFTDADGFAWDDEQPQEPDFTLEELAGVSYTSPGGRAYTADERRNLAILAFDLAMGENGRGDPGDTWEVGGTGEHAHKMGRGFELPRWAAEAVMADALLPRAKLRLVSVSRKVAADFIRQHHSALPEINPRGLLFAVGVARGKRLVGVATCNTPTGRFDDPSGIVELTRVASDGTVKGAASKLVARVLDVWSRAARSAPRKLVTYSLTSEDGTTYKALADKGLRPVVFVRGREPSGARSGGGHEDAALARLDKIRWEAGPDAGPADWSLIE